MIWQKPDLLLFGGSIYTTHLHGIYLAFVSGWFRRSIGVRDHGNTHKSEALCPTPPKGGIAMQSVAECQKLGRGKKQTLGGRNRVIVIAESLSRVIAAIRITSILWQS